MIYFLYTLCRLAFYLFNAGWYGDRTFGQLLHIFIGGLRFDGTAIMYTNVLYILMFLLPFKFRYNKGYQTVGKYIYFIVNGIALAANCSDIVYCRFTMRRTTFDVFEEFAGNSNIGNVFGHAFVDYWPVLLFFIGLIVLMVLFYGPYVDRSSVRVRMPRAYYSVGSAIFLFGVLIVILGMRSSVKSHVRPLALNDAGAYAITAVDMPLIQNTPFAVITTVQKKGMTTLVFFENREELESIYTPVHRPTPNGAFTGENVVFIILEGFSSEVIGSLNPHLDNGQYKGYTPFLDSLIRNGRSFLHGYANGRKSIDAMPAAFLGIPGIPGQFTLSKYVSNAVNSVPDMLRRKGYETAFFCGHPNGTQGYTSFCNLIGFHRYYGMSEYGNNADYDGTWGIWDDKFLPFTAKTINQFSQPFFATVFTVSSHHPFKLPEQYEKIIPPEDFRPHRSIRYTDRALRKFFETISEEPWYRNTLFVVMADHSVADYRNPVDAFAIPIVFFRPDGSLKSLENRAAQQTDIMPTLLSYLNYDRPYVSFGFDLNGDKDHFTVNYLNGIYHIFRGDYLLTFDGAKTAGLYNLKEDVLMEKNLVGTLPDVQAESELKLKAFLQQYTARMVENRLTVDRE